MFGNKSSVVKHSIELFPKNANAGRDCDEPEKKSRTENNPNLLNNAVGSLEKSKLPTNVKTGV